MLFEQGQLITPRKTQYLDRIFVVTEEDGKKYFLKKVEAPMVTVFPGTSVMYFKRWLKEYNHGFAWKMIVLHDGHFYMNLNYYHSDDEIRAEWKKSL